MTANDSNLKNRKYLLDQYNHTSSFHSVGRKSIIVSYSVSIENIERNSKTPISPM